MSRKNSYFLVVLIYYWLFHQPVYACIFCESGSDSHLSSSRLISDELHIDDIAG